MKIQDAPLMTDTQIGLTRSTQIPTGFTGDKALTIDQLKNLILNDIGFAPLFDSNTKGQAIGLVSVNINSIEAAAQPYSNSGLFAPQSSCTNIPLAQNGIMLWLRASINDQSQIWHGTSGAIYYRRKTGGTWGSWIKISQLPSDSIGSLLNDGAGNLSWGGRTVFELYSLTTFSNIAPSFSTTVAFFNIPNNTTFLVELIFNSINHTSLGTSGFAGKLKSTFRVNNSGTCVQIGSTTIEYFNNDTGETWSTNTLTTSGTTQLFWNFTRTSGTNNYDIKTICIATVS